MGMHHGILVVAASLEAAVAALDARMPSLQFGEARGSLDTLDLEPNDDGWRLAAGELDGRAYLLDTTMLLSTDGDAIVDVSRELGCLVVGCGAETTSGSFWFYAADNGTLLRGYWNSYGDMQAPWSKGEPLESEVTQPFEDLDGEGMIAALTSLGFDYERWSASAQLRELTYDLGDVVFPTGALATELETFRTSVEIPKGRQPKPTVVRREGGFDLATPAPKPASGDSGGLLGFVRRLLGGGGSSGPTPLPGSAPPPPGAGSGSATSPRRPSAPVPSSPSAPPAARPKPISIADLPPGRKHFYLEYVGGASSKFYAVSLEEEAGGTWCVRFNYGRIGFPRAWDARVEGATWAKASTVYMGLIDEKMGKGYEPRPWPGNLRLPDGGTLDPESAGAGVELEQTLFRAAKKGTLPAETGGSIAGIPLPDATIHAAAPEGGNRGEGASIWASNAPVRGVGELWARIAAVFPETGVWPVVIDATYGFDGFGDYLMDLPRGRHTEAATILRRNWGGSVDGMEDLPLDHLEPFGRAFPGLAAATPGGRVTSIDSIVGALDGHLGLVAVNRPADVLDALGWGGATNYDFDPLDMSTVLRSWEVRFDAYLVGLGTDTINLAVGRPPRDLDSATAIAAEHYAFCLDNIDQGAGSIEAYAPLLVNEGLWPFWWD